MWALLAAPLIVATDVRGNHFDAKKKQILLNKDIIAVNQVSKYPINQSIHLSISLSILCIVDMNSTIISLYPRINWGNKGIELLCFPATALKER